MELIIKNILVTLAAFVAMEAVAWFTHKYIMHGLLWKLHKDHHKKDSYGFFERNDFFFLIFALPGMTALYFGMEDNYSFLFFIGLGITLYGFTYFMVHEIFIHQRFKYFRNTDYKHLDKEDGECFGMLWVPLKFFRDLKSKASA
jgi:beta-carotene 3-hydroxylase